MVAFFQMGRIIETIARRDYNEPWWENHGGQPNSLYKEVMKCREINLLRAIFWGLLFLLRLLLDI